MKKLLIETILALSLLNSLLIIGLQVFAQPPGVIVEINSDIAWQMSDGPHVLTGPFLVKQGVTLTIQAGSIVDLNGYELRVNGTLRAIGTLSNQISFSNGKITFTEYSNPWDEQTGTGSSIQFALLESVEIVKNVPVSINDNSLASDDVWTAEDSPVNFFGQLIIDEGAVLTINPGVTLNLNGFDLVVKGTLQVLGTESNKVYFNGGKQLGQIKFTEFSVGWDEQTSSGSKLEYVVLNGVKITSEVSLMISYCNIQGEVRVGAESALENNTIQQLYISGGSVTVSNNHITNITCCYGAPKILGNTIGLIFGSGGNPVIAYNNLDGIGYLSINYEGRKTNFFSVISLELKNNLITGGVHVKCGSGTISGNKIIGFNQSYTYLGYDYNAHSGLYYLFFSPPEVTEYILSDGIVIIGDVNIVGNEILGCKTGVRCENRSKLVIVKNNFIADCTDYGIDTKSQKTIIQNNTIADCPTAIKLCNSSTIHYNNIQNSSQHSIYLDETSANIDATNNWWGTTDSEEIGIKIYDSKYSFDLGEVTFMPCLTELNPQAKPDENIERLPSSIPEFSSWIILFFVIVGFFLLAICKNKIQRFTRLCGVIVFK